MAAALNLSMADFIERSPRGASPEDQLDVHRIRRIGGGIPGVARDSEK